MTDKYVLWLKRLEGLLTTTPDDWIVVNCVGEKMRVPDSLAAINRFATRDGRFGVNCSIVAMLLFNVAVFLRLKWVLGVGNQVKRSIDLSIR